MWDIICGILGLDVGNFQVIMLEVGGGFGIKLFCYCEYLFCFMVVQVLGCLVCWVGDWMEYFIIDVYGWDNLVYGELVFDVDNWIIGVRVYVKVVMGVYLYQFGLFIFWVGIIMIFGFYDILVVFVKVEGVYSYMVLIDVFCGVGCLEVVYLIECLIDKVGEEIGFGLIEFCKFNFIKLEQMFYIIQMGWLYDIGNYGVYLDKVLKVVDWQGFLVC